MFDDAHIASDLAFFGKDDFRHMAYKSIDNPTIARLEMESWDFEMAPVQSEIIWDMLGKNECTAAIKTIGLLILLFVVCIFCCTPSNLVNLLDNLTGNSGILSNPAVNTWVST